MRPVLDPFTMAVRDLISQHRHGIDGREHRFSVSQQFGSGMVGLCCQSCWEILGVASTALGQVAALEGLSTLIDEHVSEIRWRAD